MTKTKQWIVAISIVVLSTAAAYGETINLATTNGGAVNGVATGVIGGTYRVDWIDQQSTGTGVIDPFVRINPGGNQDFEAGYNTSLRPAPLDDNSSPTFTKALLLSAVPIVNLGGTNYREFLLDVNQTGDNPLLSLNQIQLFLANADQLHTTYSAAAAGSPAVIGFGSATEIFRMSSAAAADEIILDFTRNPGSGAGDMFLYLRDSIFTGGFTNVILFSQFGTPNGTYFSNDGFEEWAVRIPGEVCPPDSPPGFCRPQEVVPEPASLVLLGTGLAGIALAARKRARKS